MTNVSHTLSLIMRLGLRHSFNEGYTAEEIEGIVRGVPFGDIEVQAEGAGLEIRLKKEV